MKLALVFLNKIEFLDDILAAFLEIGVRGATVIDSVGMGHIISQHIPIFAGLRDAFAGSSPNNKIILVVVEEDMVKKISEVVDDICWSQEESGSGFMISLDVDKVFGLKQE